MNDLKCINAQSTITERVVGAAALLASIANQDILMPQGLSVSGYKILLLLEHFPELTPAFLIEKLSSTKSNISQRLNFLEKNGYIKRVRAKGGKDKRSIAVIITENGKKKLAVAKKAIRKKSLMIEKFFSKDEIKLHSDFLDKLSILLFKHKQEICKK